VSPASPAGLTPVNLRVATANVAAFRGHFRRRLMFAVHTSSAWRAINAGQLVLRAVSVMIITRSAARINAAAASEHLAQSRGRQQTVTSRRSGVGSDVSPPPVPEINAKSTRIIVPISCKFYQGILQ